MKIKIDDNFLFSSLGFGEKYSRFCMIPTMLYRSFKYLRYRPPNMMIFEWRTPILKYKRHLCNSLYKKPKKNKKHYKYEIFMCCGAPKEIWWWKKKSIHFRSHKCLHFPKKVWRGNAKFLWGTQKHWNIFLPPISYFLLGAPEVSIKLHYFIFSILIAVVLNV